MTTVQVAGCGKGALRVNEWRGIPEEYRNKIVTGDARELAKRIPDESIDLIFTDPVYDQIDDYRWLALASLRVLKPCGALLLWSNGKWHKKHTDQMEFFGLTYRYTFTNIMIRAAAPMNGHIVSKANRVIWLDKAGSSKMVGYLADGSATTTQSWHNGWSWSKSPKYTEMAIDAFTNESDIVFDPFCGEGSIPAVAKYFQRNYIGFEIDPVISDKGRDRVRHMQPMLFAMPQPEQLSLME